LQLQQYLDRQLKSGKAKAFKPEDIIDEKHRLAKASGKGGKVFAPDIVDEEMGERRLSKSGKGGKVFAPDIVDDVEMGERRLSKSSKSKSGKGRRLSKSGSSKSGKGRRLSKSGSKSSKGSGRRLRL
jgi:hypothetical protein